MIAEHDGTTGQVLREYVWLGDMPLALITGPAATPQYLFIHTGQLDEPLMVTDMAQAKQWDVVNDPWGNALPLSTPAIAQDLRLPGQYHHVESGLFQNWHRDYDPTLGRYIEADPIGLDGGSNAFAYADGNPVNAIDPEGLNPVTAGRVAIGVGELAGQGSVWWCRSNLALCARTVGPSIVRAGKAVNSAISALSDWCDDDDNEEERCQKVVKKCTEMCIDRFVDEPGRLPGIGHDMAGRIRRCIRECTEAQGCYNY